MTKTQAEAVNQINAIAKAHWSVDEIIIRDFREESTTLKDVSIAIFFSDEFPLERKSVHFFVGPRGGIRYPVQTGANSPQVCKKFDWDFLRVADDQEKGWQKYYEGL